MSYPRAKEIFLEVCDLPPGERAASIQAACGNDAELRQAVVERPGEAEGPARQALELRRKVFPPDHYRICDAKSLVGIILVELGQGPEGAEMMEAAWECFERADRTPRAIQGGMYGDLAAYYERAGMNEEAADLRGRLGQN